MPASHDIAALADRTENYLCEKLLPFWLGGAPDRECGGVLTYFDRTAAPTGETTKPFLMQIRDALHACPAPTAPATATAAAPNWPRTCASSSSIITGTTQHDGWFWIADRARALDRRQQGRLRPVLRHVRLQRVFLATGDTAAATPR